MAQLETFSTAGLAPRRKLEYWNDIACDTFTPPNRLRPFGLQSQSSLAALLALAIFAILPAASALPATIGASNASHAMSVNRS